VSGGPGAAAGRKPRPGDRLELLVEELDERGRPCGRHGELVVRFRDAAPGSRVRARVHRRRRDEVEASVEEVLEPGPDAVAPRCAHFGVCGGCRYQGLAYAAQLAELGRSLARVLAPLEGMALGPGGLAIDAVLGCPEPWAYRNKMDFTFGSRRWIEPHEPAGVRADFAVGLHVPGRFDRLVDVTECPIAFPEATAILASARELARARGLAPWDVRTHAGLLRHLVLRKGIATGEVLAYLVTTDEPPGAPAVEAYARALLARHPEVTTLVHGVNRGVAMVATGEEQCVLHGRGAIDEVLAGVRFRVSPESFFQTNTQQAERLVELVREEARLAPADVLLDLYCGAGTFALCLAREARLAIGLEAVASAVLDAELNATRNGIGNARFLRRDLAAGLEPGMLDGERPRVAVVDPPRAGLHPAVLAALRTLAPERIVYVSCNPKSAARDLRALAARWALARVRPIDLFPHTPHLECVFTLERRPEAAA